MKTAGRIVLASFVALALALPASGFAKGGKGKKAPDGATLFKENCSYCHGNGGRGDGPNAAKLSPTPADLTRLASSEDDIAAVVRNGKGSCPSWRASLSEEEIAAVARWARSLQR